MLENPHITTTTSLLAQGFLDKSNLMSVVLFFAAAMIIFWVLFRVRHRRGGKRGGGGRSSRGASEFSTATAHSRPQELDRWNVEMHETARDLSAQLDTKMVALQTLIRSAQEEEARLKELIKKAEEARR